MSVLDEILDGVRADLADRQQRVSLEQLKDMARRAQSPLDALAALKAEGVSVIAEVKRASPSRGAMAAIDDPAALAAELAARAGIVEHGLFLGLTSAVVVAGIDGVRWLTP